MKEIIKIIETSLINGDLINHDKKLLRKLLKNKNYSAHNLNVLRSKVFDIIRAKTKHAHTIQLINWVEEINKLLLPTITNENDIGENQCFFSPGNDCEDTIITSINKARTNIKICVFTISENEISEALIKVHNKGINVKIITDNDKLNDTGSDIRLLSKEGIQVKIDSKSSHMHHKFCLIDKKILLTGSYNWTKSAADKNQENLLITEDKKSVKLYLREFERLWDKFKYFNG